MAYTGFHFRFSAFLWTLILLGVAWGCEKNQRRNFPNVQFDQYIYLNNPSNFPLRTVGGAMSHDGGYRGLIIFRRFINNGNDDFVAFDRGCPIHYQKDCGQLEITEGQDHARCPCEDEEYLLFDGSPASDATIGLIPYPVTFDGSVIYVTN